MPILFQCPRYGHAQWSHHAVKPERKEEEEKKKKRQQRSRRIPAFDTTTLHGRLGEYFCLPYGNRWKPVLSQSGPTDAFAYRFLKSKGPIGVFQLAIRPGSPVLSTIDPLTHYRSMTHRGPDVCRTHLLLPTACCIPPSGRKLSVHQQPFLGWTCVSEKTMAYARDYNRELELFMDTVVGCGVLKEWPKDLGSSIGLVLEWSVSDFFDEILHTIRHLLPLDSSVRARVDEISRQLHWVRYPDEPFLFDLEQVHELFRTIATIKLL